jgi:hypothetical protein
MLAALMAAYLLVAAALVQADSTQHIGAGDVRVVDVSKPRAHTAAYLYMSFEGCRNALQGVNPDNGDNDVYRAAQYLDGTFYGFGNSAGISSDNRMWDGTIQVWGKFWSNAFSRWKVVEFRCRRLSSTNVDDWIQNYG